MLSSFSRKQVWGWRIASRMLGVLGKILGVHTCVHTHTQLLLFSLCSSGLKSKGITWRTIFKEVSTLQQWACSCMILWVKVSFRCQAANTCLFKRVGTRLTLTVACQCFSKRLNLFAFSSSTSEGINYIALFNLTSDFSVWESDGCEPVCWFIALLWLVNWAILNI